MAGWPKLGLFRDEEQLPVRIRRERVALRDAVAEHAARGVPDAGAVVPGPALQAVRQDRVDLLRPVGVLPRAVAVDRRLERGPPVAQQVVRHPDPRLHVVPADHRLAADRAAVGLPDGRLPRLVRIPVVHAVVAQAGVQGQPVERPLLLHVDPEGEAAVLRDVGQPVVGQDGVPQERDDVHPVRGAVVIRAIVGDVRAVHAHLQVVAAGHVGHRAAEGARRAVREVRPALRPAGEVAVDRQVGQVGDARQVGNGLPVVTHVLVVAVHRPARLEQQAVGLRPHPAELDGVDSRGRVSGPVRRHEQRAEHGPLQAVRLQEVGVAVVGLQLVLARRLPRQVQRLVVGVGHVERRPALVRHVRERRRVPAVEGVGGEEVGPLRGVADEEPQAVLGDRTTERRVDQPDLVDLLSPQHAAAHEVLVDVVRLQGRVAERPEHAPR